MGSIIPIFWEASNVLCYIKSSSWMGSKLMESIFGMSFECVVFHTYLQYFHNQNEFLIFSSMEYVLSLFVGFNITVPVLHHQRASLQGFRFCM